MHFRWRLKRKVPGRVREISILILPDLGGKQLGPPLYSSRATGCDSTRDRIGRSCGQMTGSHRRPRRPSSKMIACCKLAADDGWTMIHAGVVMVRCPATGRELSTGVEMDAATFERLPDIQSQIKCPVCRLDHNWSTRAAWLGNPAPSAPTLPWLFINNRSAAND